jgi:hypothetical protein
MNDRPHVDETRLLELLAEQAAFGLSAADLAELTRLLQAAPQYDADAMDRAAASVELGMLASGGPVEPEEMPAALRQKIAAAAIPHVQANAAASSAIGRGAPVAAVPSISSNDSPKSSGDERPAPLSPRPKSLERPPLPVWTWWAIAAGLFIASGVLLAIQGDSESSPVAAYRQMTSSDSPDVVRVQWIDPAKPDLANGLGDVVWNQREQRGYMRFRGLAVNDPTKEQYQLWIFDKTRDERYPVDGGVFDIAAAERDPSTGDVIVPIHAALPIKDPAMFAITIEQPGGVVVSSRERLPLLAKVE